MIAIRRAYEQKSPDEVFSVFVDRLWPRGIKKQDAQWDLWTKEVAPSVELRKWFNHEIPRWEEFKLLYTRELQQMPQTLHELKKLELQHSHLTLVYAAKDSYHNHALVIKAVLDSL
ncbi:DUF488 family protein [Maribellus sp. CM-23]|uniref:DUF488 domain-containing protein n=1 Tax=Maribellus sp. CM-23 TaxID=2781026 RepID=UPI001F1C4E99|nr:DUF488 family protein [Maribellus sp. CM-23]MCE4564289.1 DUF488 family protein [Maribellus sp. CM-23]